MYFSQSRFYFKHGCRNPALALVAGMPAIDSVGLGGQELVHVLDAVRGFEDLSEFREKPQAVKRQRLFKSFFEACNGRLIDKPQFALNRIQALLRLLIGG